MKAAMRPNIQHPRRASSRLRVQRAKLSIVLMGLVLFAMACDGQSEVPTIPANVTCNCVCDPVVCESGSAVTQTPSAGVEQVAQGGTEPLAVEEREHVTLMLWHSYRGDEEEALNQVIALYNSTHEDTTIETLSIPFDAYPDRITAAIPRGRGPDFFIFAHDRIGDWADEGVIEPINFWTSRYPDLLSEYYDVTVQALVYRRRLFGLPLAFKSLALFYNTDLVETPPTTTDDMIALAASLTNTEAESGGTYGLVYENTKLYFHAPWIYGFGGEVIDAEGTLQVDSEACANALRFAVSLHQEHHLIPDNAYTQMINALFSDGRAAMIISGPWFRGEIADNLPWSVAPLPTVSATGLPARPFLTSEAIMISARSENKERAFEVARWMTTDMQSATIRMNVGHQPVSVRAAYDDEAAVDPIILVFRDQMENSVPMPNVPMMLRTWGHMDTALFNAIRNGEDVETVLRTARERIEGEMQ